MKKIISLLFILCFAGVTFADITNTDKPLKGEYVFPLKKLWEISGAGPDAFAYIRQVQVSDNGSVVVHDVKNKKFYIFAGDKKFIGAFGKKGEGPGEIKFIEMAGLFAVNDKLIVVDIDKLHYFSLKGNFLHSVPNHMLRRRPVLFIDENRFISAPLFKSPELEGESQVILADLKNNKEKVLATFTAVERQRRRGPGGRRGFSMAFRGVTPMMVVGYHEGKIYYGKNDQYLIHTADLEGKKINTFGIERPKKKISLKTKEQLVSRGSMRLSELMKARIIQNIPDEATCFDAIHIHKGLIFVFVSDPGMTNEAHIDIFSPDGKYLYRSFIKIEKDYTINFPILIKGKELYLILTDEEGRFKIAKYKIELPLQASKG
jgi:hypothetical protein